MWYNLLASTSSIPLDLVWLDVSDETAFRKEVQKAPIRFTLQPSKAFCTAGWRARNYGYRYKYTEAQHGSDGKQQVIECQLNVKSCLSSEFDSRISKYLQDLANTLSQVYMPEGKCVVK